MGDSEIFLLVSLSIPIAFIVLNIIIASRMNKKWGVWKFMAWLGCTFINVASFLLGIALIGPDIVNPNNKTETLLWVLCLTLPLIMLFIVSGPSKSLATN
jgi:purine-cytosine permease-like protein